MMSILNNWKDKDTKLAAKIYNMALARHSLKTKIFNKELAKHSLGIEFNNYDELDSLCIEELENSFEPYRKKHVANGSGDVRLTQIVSKHSALIFAYRCNRESNEDHYIKIVKANTGMKFFLGANHE
jgi:hypothetical protein